ncbi:MAG: hypothetical protein MUE40_08920 [Anaerolineae bacterium]|nr:hypothetical protein [Anaerolineae bacterium]
MEKLTRTLMTLPEKPAQVDKPQAIFGTLDSLPRSLIIRPPFRVGLWPCRSSEQPDVAMGLWTVLAGLLDAWQDLLVYRLFARLEGAAEDYEWTLDQSQFEIDDWNLELLDENCALSGTLTRAGGGWQLSVLLENDLIEEEDAATTTFAITAPTLTALIGELPALARQLVAAIGAENRDPAVPEYVAAGDDDPLLPEFLRQLFMWEINLLLTAWGQPWYKEDILADYAALLEAGSNLHSDFAAWAVSSISARALLPGFDIAVFLTGRVGEVVNLFPDSRAAPVLIAGALYQAEKAEAAYTLLIAETEAHPDSTCAWLRLAALYGRSGRLREVIDTLQAAIEAEAADEAIYRQYASAMLAAAQYQQTVPVLLIDGQTADNPLLREAIAACEAILRLNPTQEQALYRRALYLAELGDQALFNPAFAALVAHHQHGDLLREVVDAMHDLDDLTPALEHLEAAVARHPQRLDLQSSLAAALLLADRADEAIAILDAALTQTEDVTARADIERLLLTAYDPEFEHYFGELSAQITARHSPTTDEIDFLEEVVEKAPSWPEAALTLARGYTLWQDRPTAIEVLLDAQKTLPDHPDILADLGEALWHTGEKELALKYLNMGLAKHPNHVLLLLRTGRFLFDNEQPADARVYFSRAEAIDPLDPQINEMRRYIAGKVAGEAYKAKLDAAND